MAQPGDYGERRSEPWTYSRNSLPIKIYSTQAQNRSGKNKTLRPRYRRPKKFLTIEAVQRMLAKVVPPDDEATESWASRVIAILRDSTLQMLDRLLPWLSDRQISALYEFCIGILDKFFQISPSTEPGGNIRARALIIYIADRTGLTVTIKK